jgi:hypothetical protein
MWRLEMPLKIGIIGSRRRDEAEDFYTVERAFWDVYEDGCWIVSGGCPKGGDAFAKRIHQMRRIPYLEFPPNWEKHGKAAGFVRNTDIADNSDILIACVAPDRKGGTEDTIKKFVARCGEEKLIIV